MSSIFKIILVSWLKVYKKKSHFTVVRQGWDFQKMDFLFSTYRTEIILMSKDTVCTIPWVMYFLLSKCNWPLSIHLTITEFCKTYLALRLAYMLFLSPSITLPVLLSCRVCAFFSEVELKAGTHIHAAQTLPKQVILLC